MVYKAEGVYWIHAKNDAARKALHQREFARSTDDAKRRCEELVKNVGGGRVQIIDSSGTRITDDFEATNEVPAYARTPAVRVDSRSARSSEPVRPIDPPLRQLGPWHPIVGAGTFALSEDATTERAGRIELQTSRNTPPWYVLGLNSAYVGRDVDITFTVEMSPGGLFGFAYNAHVSQFKAIRLDKRTPPGNDQGLLVADAGWDSRGTKVRFAEPIPNYTQLRHDVLIKLRTDSDLEFWLDGQQVKLEGGEPWGYDSALPIGLLAELDPSIITEFSVTEVANPPTLPELEAGDEPLRLYFDLASTSREQILELLGLLSDQYQELSGDRLVIQDVSVHDLSSVLDPTGA